MVEVKDMNKKKLLDHYHYVGSKRFRPVATRKAIILSLRLKFAEYGNPMDFELFNKIADVYMVNDLTLNETLDEMNIIIKK